MSLRDLPEVSQATPAFGQADLSNCERELIHLAGSIQPHGALLVVREPDLVVTQASTNAQKLLGSEVGPLGQPLRALSVDLHERVEQIIGSLSHIPVPIRARGRGGAYDLLLHRPPSGGLVIELERASPSLDLGERVHDALRAVIATGSIRALADETARVCRSLTGYDRVMVYRFDDDGHGEVLSEDKRDGLEAFLGNRYPASDIPQIARRLYERNRIRLLVDVSYEPVPIVPRAGPDGRELDMSLCFTRSMSPIHIQYLKNMGVCATLVVSLMVSGRLWGLISCHHYESRFIQCELRAVCELIAEVVSTRIAALESFAQSQAEISVRRLEQRMIEAISRDGDWRAALFDPSAPMLKPLGASGAALLLDGQVLTVGEVPATAELRAIGDWLDAKDLQGNLFSTCSLGLDDRAFASLVGVASGLVAAPVSTSPGEYFLWFRPEQIRTVVWGGNPFKPVVVGNDPADLSPRRSFSQWHQVVEGTSEPWTAPVLTTARLIAETVSDVIVQFRSVSMLIAQTQLELVRAQVQRSGQAVIVAGADGRIVLANAAFAELLPSTHPTLRQLDDLPALFKTPANVRQRLQDLVSRRQTWRDEVELVAEVGEGRPILVRADPVFSAPGHVLGFVVIATDMQQRKQADRARRRFQEQVLEQRRAVPSLLPDDEASNARGNHLPLWTLLSSIVENAQLAALEITDGVEVGRMPAMLDSVKTSVDRSSELLRLLVQHAASTTRH